MDLEKVYKRVVANFERQKNSGWDTNIPYVRNNALYVTRVGGKYSNIPEAYYVTSRSASDIDSYVRNFAQAVASKYGEEVAAKILTRWAKDPYNIERTIEDIVVNQAINNGADVFALADNREVREVSKDHTIPGFHAESPIASLSNGQDFLVSDIITPKITTPELYRAFKKSKGVYDCIIPKFTESGAVEAVIAKGGYLKLPMQYVTYEDRDRWFDSVRKATDNAYSGTPISDRGVIVERLIINAKLASGALSYPYVSSSDYSTQRARIAAVEEIDNMRRALFSLYDIEILAPSKKSAVQARASYSQGNTDYEETEQTPLTRNIARKITVLGDVFVNQDIIAGSTITEITPMDETSGLDYTVENIDVLNLDNMGGQQ